MNTVKRYSFCIFCLLICTGIKAQVSQELLDKARQAGMSEEQIQQEMSKYIDKTKTSTTTQQSQTEQFIPEKEIPGRAPLTNKNYLPWNSSEKRISRNRNWKISYSDVKYSQKRI